MKLYGIIVLNGGDRFKTCILEPNERCAFWKVGLSGGHLLLCVGFRTRRVGSVYMERLLFPAGIGSSIAGAQLCVWQLWMVLPRLVQPVWSRDEHTRGRLYPEHKYLLLNRFKEVNWVGMCMVEVHF